MPSSTTTSTPDISPFADEMVETAQKQVFVDENPIKDAIKYYCNWCGLPAAFLAIGYYGYQLYTQIQHGIPEDMQMNLSMEQLLCLRYFGSFLYFLVVFLYPPFIFEQRNPETLVMLSTILQVYYQATRKPIGAMKMIGAIVILVACFLRRLPYWRCFLNPWTKDKSELKRLITLARQATMDDF